MSKHVYFLVLAVTILLLPKLHNASYHNKAKYREKQNQFENDRHLDNERYSDNYNYPKILDDDKHLCEIQVP